MDNIVLNAEERKTFSKSARSELRKKGQIPGIFYSKKNEPIAISVLENSLKPLVFTSKTNLISLTIQGREEIECIVKDVQFDPVSDKIVHFDLIGLTRGETIQIDVPLQLQGSAVGIKEGGIIQQSLYKLDVECLPKNIPQHLDIDISELNIGDSIHVSDLSFEDIKILNTPETVVVAVSHPKVEKEPVEVEEELEEAEPEVIGKGKAEDEGAEKESDKVSEEKSSR